MATTALPHRVCQAAAILCVILLIGTLPVGPAISTATQADTVSSEPSVQAPDRSSPVATSHVTESQTTPPQNASLPNTSKITLTATERRQLTGSDQPLSAESRDGEEVERILVIEAVTDERLKRLRAENVSIHNRHETHLRVTVPTTAISTLQDLPWVSAIRTPATVDSATHGAESEGVVSMGADELHAQGVTGENVRIGIIDLGFDPTDEHIVNNVEKVYRNPSGQSAHGTATAEVVADVAPHASLYLAPIGGELEYASAIDWLVEEEVDVIVMSLSFFGQPNDGTGFVSEEATSAVENHDVIWVNSAGNQRQNHYEAQFSDTTNNSFHNFPETGDANWLNGGDRITAGTSLQISLTWDRWPTTTADYDLGVYRVNSSGSDDLVASSTRRQTGVEEPVEIISSRAPTDGRYYVAVRNADAPGSETLELFAVSGGPLGVQTPESSLAAPAVGRNITTVAASNWDQTGTTYYSSMGPTNDGRIGVDVTGPTAVTNSVYGTYAGTSASAPHVGGVAALLTSKHPVLRGSELQTLIQHSDGSTSPTPAAGYGPTDAVRAVDRADEITAIGMTTSPTRSRLNQTESTNVSVMVNNTRGITNYTLSVRTENTSRIHIENVTTAGEPKDTITTFSANQSSATTVVTNTSIGANDTVRLGAITVRGNQSGSSNLTVTVSNISTKAGYQYQPKSLTNEQTITIGDKLPDITGNSLSPTDPDGDGTFEDINGDGRASISDVQALFSTRNHEAVRENSSAFDFNEDGAVSISDVQRLFVLLQR